MRGTGRVRVLDKLGIESGAQHRKLSERISHGDRDVVGVSGKIARFRDCRGAGSRARRLGNLVADDQLRSTRLLATQRDAWWGATDADGGRDDDGEGTDGGGRGRGWRRVKSVVDACPVCWTRAAPEIIILFPKNPACPSIKGSTSYIW